MRHRAPALPSRVEPAAAATCLLTNIRRIVSLALDAVMGGGSKSNESKNTQTICLQHALQQHSAASTGTVLGAGAPAAAAAAAANLCHRS